MSVSTNPIQHLRSITAAMLLHGQRLLFCATPYLLLTAFLPSSTDGTMIKATMASPTLTLSRRQTPMLRMRATRTRDQAETRMGKRVAPRTNSQRQHRAGMEVRHNNKLPMAVTMGKDRT